MTTGYGGSGWLFLRCVSSLKGWIGGYYRPLAVGCAGTGSDHHYHDGCQKPERPTRQVHRWCHGTPVVQFAYRPVAVGLLYCVQPTVLRSMCLRN